MATKFESKPGELQDDATPPLLAGHVMIDAVVDELAWNLASLLCRECWLPWWRHGHGPFASLVDEPVEHLFDAL